MAARHKNFGSPVASSDEPITFEIYGQVFRCRPALQGVVLINFIAESASDDSAAGAKAVLEFFNKAIRPEDRERFFEMTNSEDYVIPMETLSEIMDFLVEAYAARPTQQPTPSGTGPETTGTTSMDEQSYPVVPVSVSST